MIARCHHHSIRARVRGARQLAAVAMGLVALTLVATPTVHAADCSNTSAGFEAWLGRFKQTARAQGISDATIAKALDGVTYDPAIIRLDRNQRSFKLSFEEFYARRVSSSLLARGRSLMQRHKATLDRVEKRFGVPAPVLISIWGLETNYGADTSGKFGIVRSLATLSFDCRRTGFFKPHLMDALRIIQKGDLTVSEMRGGWAGEIGQTQFLPTGYMKYAVDFDGDGRRDLYRSVPDILASTANFLKGHGWRAGEGYGPGTHNYNVLADWNKAAVYQRTISVMAGKL
jgi:lytic murein transglycosylase